MSADFGLRITPKGNRIYTDYDVASPPNTPGSHWVRFVLVSDTHSQTMPIPDGDVLLHAGDLTTLGEVDDLRAQIDWLKSLPHAAKVFVCGNHDWSAHYEGDWYQRRGTQLNARFKKSNADLTEAKNILSPAYLGQKLTYLNQGSTNIVVDRDDVRHRSWKVWGSPWSPMFGDWAFNYMRGKEAQGVHAGIPTDADILITHTPPHAIGGLDRIHDGTSVGCEELASRLTSDGDLHPMLHLFGHIHEARGVHVDTCDSSGSETIFVNAAVVDYDQRLWEAEKKFSYLVTAKPVIMDVKVDPAASNTSQSHDLSL